MQNRTFDHGCVAPLFFSLVHSDVIAVTAVRRLQRLLRRSRRSPTVELAPYDTCMRDQLYDNNKDTF